LEGYTGGARSRAIVASLQAAMIRCAGLTTPKSGIHQALQALRKHKIGGTFSVSPVQ